MVISRRNLLRSITSTFCGLFVPWGATSIQPTTNGPLEKFVGNNLFNIRLHSLHAAAINPLKHLLSPQESFQLWQELNRLIRSDLPLDKAISLFRGFAQNLMNSTFAGPQFKNLNEFYQRMLVKDKRNTPIADALYYQRLEQIIESSKKLRNIIATEDWTMELEKQVSNMISLLASDTEVEIPKKSDLCIKEFVLLKQKEIKNTKDALSQTRPEVEASDRRSQRIKLATDLNLAV